jgi:diguanylate cyclase (GGDEF)-like protein/PAS domain S-box-containing protein
MDPEDTRRPDDGQPRERASAEGTEGPRADLLTSVMEQVPDLLLMFGVTPEGQMRCQTALSSRPTADRLATVAGRAIQEIFPPEALGRFRERYEEAFSTRESVRYEERLRGPEASLFIEAVLTPIFDAEGRYTHLFWSGRDVSEQRAITSALRDSEERSRALFEHSDLGLAWVDPRGGFLEVNPFLCEMLGRTGKKLLGLSVQELAHPDDREAVQGVLSEVSDPGAEGTQIEARLVHERGDVVWVFATVSAVRDHEGPPSKLLWQIQDTTERRILQERLAHQAFHDSLTELPNRALFLDRVDRALSRLDRNPGMVAVIIVDLDGFDSVNDAHGHVVGDRVLASLAQRFGEALRQSDTVARLEGDAFGLLCEDLESAEDAATVARRLHESVRARMVVDGVEVTLSGTVGVALTESTVDPPEALLRDAAAALAQAKSTSRGGTQIFDESMREETAARQRTQADLQRALEDGEFRVFYQPQVNLESGTIVGVEVLARWQHPERGLVTPAEFISLAEESGVILPLGHWVMEQACRQAVKWRDLRGDDPLMTWVNISPRQLSQADFAETVSKILADTGADASMLCLEVTEGVVMAEAGAAVAVLRSLNDLGLRIGIDNFGKGFSSLAYLKRLPIHMLKLDRTFVAGLGTSPEDSAIAAAVINLARAMGLISLAEGVESPDQLAELRELGCDLAQGYFFSSPQPPEVIEELLGQDLRW